VNFVANVTYALPRRHQGQKGHEIIEWPTPADNTVEIVDQPTSGAGAFRPYVRWNADSGTWSQQDNSSSELNWTPWWTYAHESGHLMGLPDYYHDVAGGSIPDPGHSGWMMGEKYGTVQVAEVDFILKRLHARCPCSCAHGWAYDDE